VQSDVSNAEIKSACKPQSKFGKLDYAFNNAGIKALPKPLHEQSIDDFDELMAM